MRHRILSLRFLTALVLVLALQTPELASAIHLSQATHDHHDGSTCQICIQLTTLLAEKTELIAVACALTLVFAIVLQRTLLKINLQAVIPQTLVGLNIKMNN